MGAFDPLIPSRGHSCNDGEKPAGPAPVPVPASPDKRIPIGPTDI